MFKRGQASKSKKIKVENNQMRMSQTPKLTLTLN